MAPRSHPPLPASASIDRRTDLPTGGIFGETPVEPVTGGSPEPAASISCTQCAAICCQLKVLLLPGDDVPEHYIDIDEHGMEILGKLDDGWCVALDRERMCCSMYAQRPFVCREFAMGERDCRDERAAWRRIAISLQR